MSTSLAVSFCNLLLADEINRTSPKTQSALLEVMEERRVTVDGVTREVPAPLPGHRHTEPGGEHGHSVSSEAQVDRFMVSLSLGYPDLRASWLWPSPYQQRTGWRRWRTVLDDRTLLKMQEEIHDVFVRDRLYAYILELIRATRRIPISREGQAPGAPLPL